MSRPIPPISERASRVVAMVRRVSRGTVVTYRDLDPEAPRFAGLVMARSEEEMPWHRVVRSDGTVPKGERQLALLRAEGVPLRGSRVEMKLAHRRRRR